MSQVAVAWHICKHMQALRFVCACKCAQCLTRLVTVDLSCRWNLHQRQLYVFDQILIDDSCFSCSPPPCRLPFSL